MVNVETEIILHDRSSDLLSDTLVLSLSLSEIEPRLQLSVVNHSQQTSRWKDSISVALSKAHVLFMAGDAVTLTRAPLEGWTGDQTRTLLFLSKNE